MKYDEHGGIRMETSDEVGARYNEGDHIADQRASDDALRDSLQTRMDGEQHIAEIHRHALSELLKDRPSLLTVVESYAAAKARYLLVRDSMERCGFRSDE